MDGSTKLLHIMVIFLHIRAVGTSFCFDKVDLHDDGDYDDEEEESDI